MPVFAEKATIYWSPEQPFENTIATECDVTMAITEKNPHIVIFLDGHYYEAIYTGHADWCPNH